MSVAVAEAVEHSCVPSWRQAAGSCLPGSSVGFMALQRAVLRRICLHALTPASALQPV